MSKLDLSIVIKFIDKATQPIRQFQQNVQNTNQSIDRLTQSVDRLERSLNKNSFNRFSRNLNAGSVEANIHAGALDSMHNGYDRVAHVLDTVKQKTQSWSDTLKANRAEMREEFKALAMNSAIAGAGLYQLLKPAVTFESAMADVKKVVNFGDDTKIAASGLAKMSDEVIRMSNVLPMAANDIAKIIAAGGQSGIATNELTKFAEDAVKMGVAFDITAEESGQALAEMRTAFRMTQIDVVSLADKINYLGNNTPAAAKGIMEIVKRVGPLGEVAGYASGSIAALGATLRGMGIQEEIAATGIQNFMLALVAGESATKSQKAAFRDLGLESAKVAADMQKDAEGTSLKILKLVKQLPKEKQAAMLQDLFGKESIKSIAPLLNNMQALQDNFIKVGDASNYAGSMEAEYAARAATTANNLQLLKNHLVAIGITVGTIFLPKLNELINRLKVILGKVQAWAKANPELVRTLANIAMKLLMFKVAMLSVRYTGNLLFSTIFSMIAGITKFALFMWIATKVLGKFGIGMPSRLSLISTAVRVLGNAFIFLSRQALPLLIAGLRTLAIALLTNPITWIIAAVAALALVIWKYWGPIKAFFIGFWDGLKQGLSPLFKSLSTAFSSMKTVLAPLLPVWNALVTAFNWVKEAISGLFTPFQATNQQLKTATANGKSFGLALGTILGILGSISVKLIEFGVTLFTIVGTSIGNTVGFIVVNFGKVLTFFTNIWVQIKNAFSGGIAGISALIFNWSPLGLFYSAFAAVLKWFGVDLPSKFTGFGSMILEGLKNGILSKVQSVKDALSSAVTGVIDKARSILDIHSPSRVFAQIGDFTMQGMALGITNNQTLPATASNNAVNHLVNTTKPIGLSTKPIVGAGKPIAPVKTITSPNGRTSSFISNDTIQIHIHVKDGSVVKGTAEALRKELERVTKEERNARRKLLTDTE